jgi:ABC-type lipoprotein export system ATPase subunit
MRFVLDVTVQEFLTMRSKNSSVSINTVLETANSLCGEPIGFTSQLTTLSGGQTRALMVSDVAYNSPAPVILIDELENAGINRILALELLVKSEKIVLLVTHDPLLALYGAYRIVLKNGGIVAVHERTAEETVVFHQLKRLDNTIQGLRNNLRNSERVDLKSLCLQ